MQDDAPTVKEFENVIFSFTRIWETYNVDENVAFFMLNALSQDAINFYHVNVKVSNGDVVDIYHSTILQNDSKWKRARQVKSKLQHMN